MSRRTPLYECHEAAGAQWCQFADWQMPLHYGSQLKEHAQVREHAGLFDVSHMGIVDVTGDDAKDFLRFLLANDVARLTATGRAQYTCMLNEDGGILDDLIVYFWAPDHYRLIVNAATCQQDLAWMQQQAERFSVSIVYVEGQALLALQGPDAVKQLSPSLTPKQAEQVAALRPFEFVIVPWGCIARTGYTGEDGFEILLSPDEAVKLWQELLARGVAPCGLGARDSLRLEAGLNLYGTDMDEQTRPDQTNVGWTVSWHDEKRQFIGRIALKESSPPLRSQVGLVLRQGGVLRAGQRLMSQDREVGVITSGGFAPTLGCSVALAQVDVGEEALQVDIRGRVLPVAVVKPGFVRRGKSLIDEGVLL